jgi:TolB protein
MPPASIRRTRAVFATGIAVIAGAVLGPIVTSPQAAVLQQAAAAWTPTAATLVYTTNAGGNSDVVLRHGATNTSLTRHPAQDHSASWAPTSQWLAFQSLRDGNREIYRVAADGAEMRNLTNHPAQDLLPAVAPDGGRILFFSDRAVPDHPLTQLPGDLYVLTLATGAVERLTQTSLTSTFGGDWAPDGNSVLFARDFDGDIDLVLLDVATGVERRLDGTTAAEYGGTFSPDGARIAFHAGRDDGEARIVVMNVDGSDRREITRGAQHYSPRWSPDGDWLVFSGAPLGAAQFDVLYVPSTGGEVLPLVATDGDERSGSWRPDGG